MKKFSMLFSLATVATILSCSNQPADSQKDVIIMPVPVEKKETVIMVDTPKTTSVTLDKNGVKVETKKVKVDIKPH